MTITGAFGMTVNQDSTHKTNDNPLAIVREREAELERQVSPVYVKPDVMFELIGKKIPSFRYMLYVATCETEQDWSDRGAFGGGFGFMHKSNKVYKDYAAKQSTWLQWGGAEFAKVPWKATSKEQAVVWIRAFATGWVRPNGVYKAPTRLPSNNCSGMNVGWHTYTGQKWPVPDDWKKGDPQIKPWEKNK
jgi:hypothetical protein